MSDGENEHKMGSNRKARRNTAMCVLILSRLLEFTYFLDFIREKNQVSPNAIFMASLPLPSRVTFANMDIQHYFFSLSTFHSQSFYCFCDLSLTFIG